MKIVNLPTVAMNIRYLLWKKSPDSSKWVSMFRRSTSLSEECAKQIIFEGIITDDELNQICNQLGVELDVLTSDGLIERDPKLMVKRNLTFLMRDLPQGSQKTIALKLKKRKETVSRWATGKVAPSRNSRRDILHFIGVPESADIESDPLFLSLEPLGVFQQRAWVLERLEVLKSDELAQLFPALQRLLSKE